MALTGKATSTGNFFSSSHVLSLDRCAAEIIEQTAGRIFDILAMVLNLADLDDGRAAIEKVLELYRQQLQGVATAIFAERDKRLRTVEQRVRPFELKESQSVLTRELATNEAKIELLILGMKKTGQGGASVNNNFNISGTMTGAIQTGANATATVQNVNHAPHPDAARAVEEIRLALLNSEALNTATRNEALDLLSNLKGEIAKPVPNRTKARALMEGMKEIADVIPKIEPAVAQLRLWWEALPNPFA